MQGIEQQRKLKESSQWQLSLGLRSQSCEMFLQIQMLFIILLHIQKYI